MTTAELVRASNKNNREMLELCKKLQADIHEIHNKQKKKGKTTLSEEDLAEFNMHMKNTEDLLNKTKTENDKLLKHI